MDDRHTGTNTGQWSIVPLLRREILR